jgi:hypothetical protein
VRNKTREIEKEKTMKSIAPALMTSKAQLLGFVSVCALLLGGGVYAKVAVDGFGAQQDEFCESFNRPSQFYLWSQAKRPQPNATSTASKILHLPAASALP